MKIKKALAEEILKFCELNNISDQSVFLNKIVEAGFNLEKYGLRPMGKPTVLPSGLYQAEIVNDKIHVQPIPEKIEEESITIKKQKIEDDDYDIYDR